MIYKRIECNRGNVDYCYAVDAIKGDDTVMGTYCKYGTWTKCCFYVY